MWIAGIVKADPDTPVVHPAHLRRDRAMVKQLEHNLITLGKIALKNDHRTRRRQIGYPHNVAMAAMVQYRSLRLAFIAALHPLVEQSPQTVADARALRRRRIVQLSFPSVTMTA